MNKVSQKKLITMIKNFNLLMSKHTKQQSKMIAAFAAIAECSNNLIDKNEVKEVELVKIIKTNKRLKKSKKK